MKYWRRVQSLRQMINMRIHRAHRLRLVRKIQSKQRRVAAGRAARSQVIVREVGSRRCRLFVEVANVKPRFARTVDVHRAVLLLLLTDRRRINLIRISITGARLVARIPRAADRTVAAERPIGRNGSVRSFRRSVLFLQRIPAFHLARRGFSVLQRRLHRARFGVRFQLRSPSPRHDRLSFENPDLMLLHALLLVPPPDFQPTHRDLGSFLSHRSVVQLVEIAFELVVCWVVAEFVPLSHEGQLVDRVKGHPGVRRSVGHLLDSIYKLFQQIQLTELVPVELITRKAALIHE